MESVSCGGAVRGDHLLRRSLARRESEGTGSYFFNGHQYIWIAKRTSSKHRRERLFRLIQK